MLYVDKKRIYLPRMGVKNNELIDEKCLRLSCALLLLEQDLPPLLPMLIRSPGSGRGRQTASLVLKEIGTCPSW